jgi:DNA-binding CsgD family transcriptional regulator
MSASAQATAADWQASAACGGTNSRTFVEAKPSEAKEICANCPVRAECLYDALGSKADNGIWGGLTYHERRALPVLPADRSAALNVLRQLPVAPAPSAKASVPAKPKTPARRKKSQAKPGPAPTVRKPRKRTEPAPAAPREDVAELLREGLTHRQIMNRLNVSSPVVTATREAYKIPYRTGPGFRYAPEDRAEIERRTIELLRARASYSQIIEQVGISPPTIIRIRRQAGLEPSGQTGGHAARPKAEVLAEHVEPYGEGHARWTGPMTGRLPQLWAERTRFNARHVVFEQHYGRPPAGRVCSNCGVTTCIAGAHLTDETLRAARPKKEPPVTVQALKNLLDEIDEQGGPQAARDNRLHLTHPTGPMPEEPMTATAEPATPGPAVQPAVVVRPPVITSPSETLPIEDLLTWGDEHPDPDVQDQAARARAALAGLRTLHAANQELTEIAAEAAQLEQRLAQLRAREAELAPGKKPAPARKTKPKPKANVRDHDTAAVRAWAAANGVDCPRFGRIPQHILTAWREATSRTGGASS